MLFSLKNITLASLTLHVSNLVGSLTNHVQDFFGIELGFGGDVDVAVESVIAEGSNVSALVDGYVGWMSAVANENVWKNIGVEGGTCRACEEMGLDVRVAPGVVVASPSTDPDYVYTWTRDSAIVFKMLIDQYTSELDTSSNLRTLIEQYVLLQERLQRMENPSSRMEPNGGLGEPKFHVNETAFEGEWGRPQRDGPALRAIALSSWARWLVVNGELVHAFKSVWPLIKVDLEYILMNWDKQTFDLWEEVPSASFFTSLVQHRALREGANLANAVHLPPTMGNVLNARAHDILCFAQSFWNDTGSYIVANAKLPNSESTNRSGVDLNTILASIHTFDAEARCDATTFQPCSDKALANLWAYVNAFRDVYEINEGLSFGDAVATGRYPEDVYMGGNPWYIGSFAVAQQLHTALSVWSSQRSLHISPVSLPFFQSFDQSLSNSSYGTYSASSKRFKLLTSKIRNYAEKYLALAARYSPQDGDLAEQFGRVDGNPKSARRLTWSYAAAMTAFWKRNETRIWSDGVATLGVGGDKKGQGAGWGARGLKVKEACLGGVNSEAVKRVNLTMAVSVEAGLLERVYVIGSTPELGTWKNGKAVKMSFSSQGENRPIWKATIDLPSNKFVQYKYFKQRWPGLVFSPTWQPGRIGEMVTPLKTGDKGVDGWA